MTPDQLLIALTLLHVVLVLFVVVVGAIVLATAGALFSDELRGGAAFALAIFLLGVSIIPAIRLSMAIGDEVDRLRNTPTEEAAP